MHGWRSTNVMAPVLRIRSMNDCWASRVGDKLQAERLTETETDRDRDRDRGRQIGRASWRDRV